MRGEREREWGWRDEERVSYRGYREQERTSAWRNTHVVPDAPLHPKLSEAIEHMQTALQQMIDDADSAKERRHFARHAVLLSTQDDSYTYQCTLTASWDVQENAAIFILLASGERVRARVVKGEITRITFVTPRKLPEQVLEQFTLLEDTTWLLERALEVLKYHFRETEGQFGAKVLGYMPVTPRTCRVPRKIGAFVPNQQQRKAIAQVMGSEFTMLIGPGGTGKSLTVAGLSNLLLKKGDSVLVVSHTNIATDNLFLRQLQMMEQSGEQELLHLLRNERIVRVGTPHHLSLLQGKYRQMTVNVLAEQHMGRANEAQSEVHQRYQELREKKAEIIEQAQLVAATASSVSLNPHLMQKDFDVVIIDEISMLSLVQVLLTVSLARKQVVVAGDPVQLAPILKTVCPEWKRASKMPEAVKWLGQNLFTHLGATIFDAIYGEKACVLLTEQGRMSPPILAPLNHFIYQGMLTSRPETAYTTPVAPLPLCPLMLVDSSSSKDAQVYKRRSTESRVNAHHAKVVAALVPLVLATLPERSSTAEPRVPRIGVLTPYRSQVKRIHEELLKANLAQYVHVGTVNTAQALEFEVVILDTVEAPSANRHLVPFQFTFDRIFDERSMATAATRLLTVAHSRARHKLIYIAHREHLHRHQPENPENDPKKQRLLVELVDWAYHAGYINSDELLRRDENQK